MIKPFYESDGIVIYNARCEQVLPFLEPVDLVLTDPPYGIGETFEKQQARQGFGLADQRDYGEYDWDRDRPESWVLQQVISKGHNSIIWGGNYFELPNTTCWLVWDKLNGTTDFADCELAWTNFSGAVRKFDWRWNGFIQQHNGRGKEFKYHPTQKPLKLMEWCISQSADAASILDPFMGVGTSLVAAKQAGIRAMGIDVNEEYCSKAVERLRQGVFSFSPEQPTGINL